MFCASTKENGRISISGGIIMRNKTIIITGGSSGMGKAMAKSLVNNGASVLITGRNQERLESTVAELQSLGGEISSFQMDVRNPEQVEQMVEVAHQCFGRIDGLINNAAGNFLCNAEDLSINGWNAVIDIVLNGTFYCSRAVGKYMINQGIEGDIINIVATYARGGGPGVIHSACAKAGVLTMTETLAVEWGRRYGIRVNAIAPGPIEHTGGVAKLMTNEFTKDNVLKGIPLKRFGTLEEITSTVSFLLSEQSKFINGVCIPVDGGQSLNQMPF